MEQIKTPAELFEIKMNIQINSLMTSRSEGRVSAKLHEMPSAEEKAAVLAEAEKDNYKGSVGYKDGKITYRTEEQVKAARKPSSVPEMRM